MGPTQKRIERGGVRGGGRGESRHQVDNEIDRNLESRLDEDLIDLFIIVRNCNILEQLKRDTLKERLKCPFDGRASTTRKFRIYRDSQWCA